MGDKSPKANQKKSGQKQATTAKAATAKKAVVASKQAGLLLVGFWGFIAHNFFLLLLVVWLSG